MLIARARDDAGPEPRGADDAGLAGRQIPALDGIRGLAIIWVVLHNANDRHLAAAGTLTHLWALLAHSGWIGVQLFFALSGCLITAGLLASRGAANYFWAFYARRALRILPLYYAVLFALLIVRPLLASPPIPIPWADQASLWLFTYNITHRAPHGFWHFWSLAVEEQFHLVWPLIVFACAPRRLLTLCAWIALGALVLRGVLLTYGATWFDLYTSTLCRMDALGFGAAGACIACDPKLRAWLASHLRSVSLLALALLLLGVPLTDGYDRGTLMAGTLGYSVLAFCSAAFVGLVALSGPGSGWGVVALVRSRLLGSFGRYSYAIYVLHGLLHQLVGEPWLERHFGVTPRLPVMVLYSLGILALSYLLGLLSYHGFEKHFLRLKRRFVPT